MLREGDADSVGPIRLEWEFSILSKNGTTSSATVGFAVLKQLPDGTLPQIVPYRWWRVHVSNQSMSLFRALSDSHIQRQTNTRARTVLNKFSCLTVVGVSKLLETEDRY